MKKLISAFLIVMLAMGMIGCSKKVDDGKVPITTTSEEARKEFLTGRGLAEKLLITNSLEHFDKAISLDPNFATAYLNRANNSFTAKDFFSYMEKAVALKDKASEGEQLVILAAEAGASANVVKQKEYLDKLIALYPNDERVCFIVGGYYYGQQDYLKGIEQYKKAVALAPEYSPAYNILGYANRQIENYPEAEKALKKYVELIPNDPNPYDSYAELLMKMGRFDESIMNYQKALNIEPHFIASHIGIATNYMYKGMADSGTAELTRLTSEARNDGEMRQALFTQMVLFVDAGKMDFALQELDKQMKLGEKTNDVAAISADYGFQGAILLEMGKADDARKAFETSAQFIASSDLSQDIKNNAELFLHYNLATVALEKKDLKKAKAETAEFSKAATANKNMNQIRLAHELAGRIAFGEKKNDTAIEEFQQANHQNPYDVFRLALAYHVKGDKANAKEFCKKAAQFNGLPALNYAFIRTKAEKLFKSF